MNLHVDELKPGDATTRSHSVLYLRGADRGGPWDRLVEQMVRHSVNRIVRRPAPGQPDLLGGETSEALLHAWRELASQFMSSSLGVIAEAGDGYDAVLRLLADGQAGGELPGAIAFIGFDGRLPDACLPMAGELARSPRDVQFEWPSLMMFLPASDPDLAACGRACREMRAAGIPIGLEVMDAGLGPASTDAPFDALAELVREIDSHFSAHLAPVFPKLI